MKTPFMICLLLLSFYTESSAQNNLGKIKFTVKSSVSGIGLNAQISLKEPAESIIQNTNDYGENEFTLKEGEYIFYITAQDYQSQTAHFFVRNKWPLNVIVSLDPVNPEVFKETPKIASLKGYLTHFRTNKPLSRVTVKSSIRLKTKTNKEGYFELTIPADDYNSDSIIALKTVNLKFRKLFYKTIAYDSLIVIPGNTILKLNLKKGIGRERLKYSNKNITPPIDPFYDENENLENNYNVKDVVSTNNCFAPYAIRVFHGKNGSECKKCKQCTVIEQMSLEYYVKSGLDNEWITSWEMQSLMAGAVAYRTYGAYHVYHPYGVNYDIVAHPCRQNWQSEIYSHTEKATAATENEVLMNKDKKIIFSEYASETNNFGYGDCYSGQGKWPANYDSVCCHKSPLGHGRGMCQWGSNRWAKLGRTYDWILEHYYSPMGYVLCKFL